MENQLELENNNQPQPPTYTKGLFLNLQQAFGKENLPDEATFTKKITTDKVYRDGVHKNLIAAYGQENVPDLSTFDSKVLGSDLKKKEQPVPTEKPSQVSAKSSQLGVTEKAKPTTSELGVGEEAPIVPSWKMGGKEPLAKESTFVRPTTKINIEQQQQIKQIQNNALTNTAKNKLSAQGKQVTPANISSEIKNIEKAAKDGEVSLVRKGNEYYYGRTPKWHEEFAKQFVNTIGKFTDNIDILVADSKNDPALMVKTLDDIKARKDVESRMTFNVFDMMKAAIDPSTSVAENAMKMFNAEKDKTPLAKPSLAGDIAGFVGGIAPKAMASSFGLVPTAVQAVMTSSQDKIEQLYDKYQQDFLASDPTASAEYQQTGVIPQKIKEAAATKAIKNADIQAAPTALLDAMLFSGTGAKATPQAKNLGEALARGFKNANIMGAKGTAAELATIGIEQAQGDKPEDIVRRLADTYGNWVAIDASFQALPILKSLPKYLSSAIKDFATSKEAKPIVDDYLNKLPNGKEIKAELNKWEEDKKPLEGIVPEDKMASVAGLNQKIKGLKEKLNEVPDSLKEDIKIQIDNTNKQIKDIVSSDKPSIDFEKDDLTGEILGEKPIEAIPEVKPIALESKRQEQYDVLADLAKKNPEFKFTETFEDFNKKIDSDPNYLSKIYDESAPYVKTGELVEIGGTKEAFIKYLTEKPTEVTTTTVTPTEAKTTIEAIQPEVKITIDSESLKKNTQPEVDRVKTLSLENEDGATFNLDGTKHQGGLVVPVESLNTTRAELTPELINDFVEKNKDKISGDNFKVGIYKFPNSEKVSIDLNIVVDPKFKDAALEFGKLAGQESLFDLDSFQNVKTGATGENPKSFTPKEFFDIAKSLAKGEVPEVVKTPEVTTEIKAEVKAEPKTIADTVADDLFTHLGIEPESAEATAPRVYTSENVSELTSEGLEGDQKAVIDSVKNIVTAIDKLVEATTGNKLKVSIYDNQASFTKGVEEYGGSKQDSISKGFYMSEDGTIHINMSRASSETMGHEGFHPVLDYLAANKPEIIDNFHKQLSKIKGGDKIIADAERAYKGMGDTTIKKEAITDFIAKIADPNNPLQLDKTNFEKVKAFVLDMLEKMGLKFDKDIRTIDDLKKLAQVISKKFQEGKEIKVGDKNPNAPSEYISSDGKPITNKQAQFSVQNDFSDVKTKVTFTYIENSKDFEKLKKDGYITEDKKLSDFKGKYIFLHSPDNAFTGNISKNGEMLIQGNGGVYYPIRFHKDGYFWASTKTAAESMARQLNTMIEKNGGTIYMALTSAPADKLLSSTTASNAVVDFFSSKAMDKNVGLKESSLKKALLEAVNSVITKEVKVKNKKTGETKVVTKKVGLDLKLPANTSLADLKSILKTKLAADNSIFADRKHFTLQLIRNISKEISGTKSEQVLGRFFKEGILNPEMKGQLKGGEYKMSAANITQALSHMLSEPMLRGQESGKVYAVIEINGKVKPVDSAAHESYPKAIQAVDANNKVKLHILQDRENWNDHFADPETGNIIEGDRKLEVYPTSGVSIEPLLNVGKEKPISQIGGMPEKAAAAPQWSKGQDLIESTGKRKEMTEDDKGNYLFFHYSDKKFNKLSPEKVGKHLATGRDERTSVPTSSLYTRPDRLETNVPSDFGYITRVPKEKVYSFTADPLNLMAEAEARFKKENKDRAFDANNQFAYVAKIASEKGFPVTVAEWNIKGTKTLIAKTTEALPLEKYTNIKAGTTNQIEFAKGTEDIKPNAKRRDIQFQKEQPTEVNPLDSEKGIDNKDFQEYNGMFSKEKASSPYLDDILNDEVNGKRGYQLFYKRKMASIEMMSPEEYLKRVTEGQKSTTEAQKGMISQERKDVVKAGINKGNKIDMPSLSYDRKGEFDTQEGRHRATIAKERGEKLIPVVIEKSANEQDLFNKAKEIINIANKDLKTNDINEIINYAADKFNLHRDALAYLKDNASELKTDLTQFQKESQDAKIKDFIEMQREKGISDEDIKAGLEKAADRIGLDKNKIDELLTSKKEANAIQEPSPEGVLQPTQEGVGEAGGKRTGMEQAEQGAIPPKEGKPSEAEIGGAEEEVVSGLTKAELSKYDSAKTLFESEGKTTWNEVVDNAVKKLIKDNPNTTVEKAAQNHVDRLSSLYDEGRSVNPTAEDLAVIALAKLNVEKQLSDSSFDLNSDDVSERNLAVAEFDRLNQELIKIAKATNPREAGLAFGIRQMLLSTKNGLEIRRMELMKNKGGEKLTDAEMTFTREQWAKEKKLMQEQSELKEKKMQEDFDAALKLKEKEYQDLLAKRGAVEVSAAKAKSRQEVLKQKGKDLADKLRSNKQSGFYSDPFLVGKTLNFVLDTVADLVEAGADLASAIDKFVSDNRIQSRRKMVEDAIFDHLNRQEKRSKAIDAINEIAADTEAKTITKDMVLKNAIKDFVDSYVNTVELNQVSDVAFKKLKELLPNITKEQFKQAYLKVGEFKIEKSNELKNQATEQQRVFNRMTNLENQLAELKKKNDLLKDGDSKKEAVQAEIQKINQKIQSELTASGRKVSSTSSLAKEGYEKRSNEHDKNIDEVVKDLTEQAEGLTGKEKDLVDEFLGKLNDSKIDYDPASKLNQSSKVENATEKIDLLEKQLDVLKKSIDKDLAYQMEMGLQKIKDRFNSTKEEVNQSVMLEQAKKDALNRKKEFERKIVAKEFDDTVPKKTLTKTDAELIENEAQLATVKSAYDKLAEKYRREKRTALEVVLETGKSIALNTLIGMPKTFFKLAIASPAKISQTYLSKAIFGKLAELSFNKGIIQRAKEGGESSSFQAMNEGLKQVFSQKTVAELEKNSEKDAIKYTDSATKYENAIAETKRILDEKGENSKEYKNALEKQEKLRIQSQAALKQSVGNTIGQYIGGSTLKTMWEKLVKRNSQYEKAFGDFNSEEWTKINNWKHVADNVSYIFGFVGRSHGALKSISARYHFGVGFMARLEAALEKGEDITDFQKLKEIASDSYTDWESGMYQQENWVTGKTNKIIDYFKRSDVKAARVIGNLASWDVAITKVPVNMINEAIVEMTLGLPISLTKYTREYIKASKIAKAEVPLRLTEAQKADYKAAIQDTLSKMDKRTAVAIVRCFRHGGFGLGIMALAVASGAVKFGGFPHLGQKKEDEKKRADELKTAEIEVGDTKLNEYISGALEHTTSLFPTLTYLAMQNDWAKGKGKGLKTYENVSNLTVNQLEHIVNSYPQSKIFNPVTVSKEIYKMYSKAGKKAVEEYSGGAIKFEEEAKRKRGGKGSGKGGGKGSGKKGGGKK